MQRGNESSYPPIIDPTTNNIVSNSEDKAKLFNNYFLSHSSINTENATLPAPTLESELKLTDIVITEQEVLDQLSNIDTAKATGWDDISPKLLHKAGNSIVSLNVV